MSLDRDAFLRYSRHLLMADIGEAGQQKLLQGRVLVVGLGGLGCPVSLYLAAAGVGELVLCDPDHIDLTNLQRQVLYRMNDIGASKVDVAARELVSLNPGVKVTACPQSVQMAEAAGEMSFDGFDAVADCTDNLAVRHWLNRFCHRRRIPLVSAAVLGWLGQLMTLDFSRQPSPCLACATPEDSAEPMANCANSGVLGPLLGVMGSMQAISVMRLLLNRGDPEAFAPAGRLQRFDARREQWSSFAMASRPGCPVCDKTRAR
ncbi:MAG: HesA/MoeB/ThiF family protein [Bacteroidales bacterium]|nr:HesA/MoeB/ThiF family protein [Bacteroidales bacterium]